MAQDINAVRDWVNAAITANFNAIQAENAAVQQKAAQLQKDADAVNAQRQAMIEAFKAELNFMDS